MLISPFRLTPFNTHYEGEYTDRAMKWRRICAIDKVNNLQALVRDSCIETVLEVGCGTGAVLAEVARRGIGRQHVGVDLADPRVHADPDAHELTLIQYDGKRLPFGDASFDLVYASHVVEHVPDPRGFISEISRVAKKAIYIEVPCELHIRTTQKALQTTIDIGHINSYSPESFLLLLQTAGLDVQDIRIFDYSLEAQQFHTTVTKGLLRKTIRGALLSFNPILASRFFTYHCGALTRPRLHAPIG